MSLKTIITMLLLGSSSVAVAQPMVRDHRDNIRFSGEVRADVSSHLHADVQFGFERYNDSYDARDRHDDRWHDGRRWKRGHSLGYGRFEPRAVLIAPASQMSLSNDGYAYSRVDERLGAITALEIDGLGGVQDIDAIHLQLADGTSRAIQVRRDLSAHSPVIRIDLGRRGLALKGIYVYGYSPTRTALQITGMVR
jgi:hypothetical protein